MKIGDGNESAVGCVCISTSKSYQRNKRRGYQGEPPPYVLGAQILIYIWKHIGSSEEVERVQDMD